MEQESGCYGNAVGLRNPGREKDFLELAELRSRHGLRTLPNVSLSAGSIEDFVRLVRKFEPVADKPTALYRCSQREMLSCTGAEGIAAHGKITVAAFSLMLGHDSAD